MVAGRLPGAIQAPSSGASASLGLHFPLDTGRKAWAASGPVHPLVTSRPDDVALATRASNGREGAGPGTGLFERIIVTPRSKALGFVLPDTSWEVEIWNAFRRAPQTLTGLVITGAGGVQVSGPEAMVYAPGQAQVYTAEMPVDGPTTIDQVVTWSFEGILGTDMRVTGTRITVFPHRPDWSEPFRELLAWRTLVLTATHKRTEQRIRLRTRPRITLSFRAVSTTELETASLEALLYAWQGRVFGVPVWPEQSDLLAAVPEGAEILPVDTRYRPAFEAGGLAVVWSGFDTWEAYQVLSLTDGTLTLSSPTGRAWPAGTRVIPLRRARLLEDLTLRRSTNWVTAATFVFSCEPT